MRYAIGLAISSILLLYLGGFLGMQIERQKTKPEPRTPDIIVSDVSRLYQFKTSVPDNVLIGILGKDSIEAFIFTFHDGIRGLQYIGVYKLTE